MNKRPLTLFGPAIISLMTITSHAESIKVVLDITRGVQQGCAYKGEEKLKCFKISGGRNDAESFDTTKGKVRFCSFTTTALNIKPQLLLRKRHSKEFDVPLDYFVSFDEVRGIGTHASRSAGYSGACIRMKDQNAKFVYDLVKENSVLDGHKIVASDVHFDVIDNTPYRIESECECLNKHIRHNSAHKVRLDKICSGSLTAEDIMNDWLLTLKPKIIRPKKRPDDLVIPEDYRPNNDLPINSDQIVDSEVDTEEFLVEVSSDL